MKSGSIWSPNHFNMHDVARRSDAHPGSRNAPKALLSVTRLDEQLP